MIRPITCVCMLLAGASGLYLYQEKHRTAQLDTQIEQIIKDIRGVHEKTALLQADWAVLNTPDRLGELATRFLDLKQTEPAQFVRYADLVSHLPPMAPPPVEAGAGMDGDAGDGPVIPALPPMADMSAALAPGIAVAAAPLVPAPLSVAIAAAPAPGEPTPSAAEGLAASSQPDPNVMASQVNGHNHAAQDTTHAKTIAVATTSLADKQAESARHATRTPAHATMLLASAGQPSAQSSAQPSVLNAGATSTSPSLAVPSALTPMPLARPVPRPSLLPRSLLARAEAAAAAPVLPGSSIARMLPNSTMSMRQVPPPIGSALGTNRTLLPPPVPISASYQPPGYQPE